MNVLSTDYQIAIFVPPVPHLEGNRIVKYVHNTRNNSHVLLYKVFKYGCLFHVLHVDSVSFIIYVVNSRCSDTQTPTLAQSSTLKIRKFILNFS